MRSGPSPNRLAWPLPNRSLTVFVRFRFNYRRESQFLARQGIGKRRFEDKVGLGEPVEKFVDTRGHVAQLAHQRQAHRQSAPPIDPARPHATAAAPQHPPPPPPTRENADAT